MRRTTLGWAVALAVAASLAPGTVRPAAAQFTKPYEVVDLAPGIFAIVWQDILEWPYEGNNLVIVNDDDVVVVDAKRTPSLADTVIAEIRKRTDKPVRYLVNTHWHCDHTCADGVFLDAFPGMELIAHAGTRRGIETILAPGFARRREFLATAPAQMASGKRADGTPLGAEELAKLREDYERSTLLRTASLMERYRFGLPMLTFEDSLTLVRPGREIRILFLGNANSEGDAVVYLPKEKILATGDLVVSPYPFLGVDDHPVEWVDALHRLMELDATTILPGHGAVQHDFAYAAKVTALFESLREQVKAAIARGDDLERIQAEVDLSGPLRAIVGDDEKLLAELLAEFPAEAARKAYREITGSAPARP